MQKNEERIAVYSRKSKFTGKGESITNQIELCKSYIRTHYGDNAAQNSIIYEDEGFSGGNLNRPDFQKMMIAAQQRKFKAIIVYRLDRISRNINDFSHLIEELARLDIAFISIKEQFDTGTPMGRAMMYMSSVFSQLERETIAERIRDNMYELAKTGRWLGGMTPTGYTSEVVEMIRLDGKQKKSCRLALIPEEAAIVQMIYHFYIQYDSQSMTESELMRRGIKTKKNNYFSRFTIKAILQNPVYAIADADIYNYFLQKKAPLFSSRTAFNGTNGIMAYNRTCQKKGKATLLRPVNEWIVTVGEHPGLIPGKLWVQVQQSLERNKSKAYRKPRKNKALLTGLLYCACGSRMYPKLTQRQTPDGAIVYTYICKTKERSRRSLCGSRNIQGNRLDMTILDHLKTLKYNTEIFIQHLKQNRTFFKKNNHEYKEKKSTSECQNLSAFQNIIFQISIEQKRTLIRTLVHKIIWDNESIHIFLTGTSKIAAEMLWGEDSK